jgi:hypothetical protein
MNEFKKGDKVVCVNNTRHGNENSLTVGKFYTVDDIDNDQLWVVDDSPSTAPTGRYKDQFELASPYPNAPHKHAELIKAWADGAEIECSYTGYEGSWRKAGKDHGGVIQWLLTQNYRIKPTPAPTIPVIIDGKTVELDLASAIAVKEALKDV